jgi:tRNA A-37 threonylcarbamoyl transferase component Bud32/tetratricopeptide (TPR) repeat protein
MNTRDTNRLTAALSHRYRIESEIDTGGMATVYRARDLKHDRTVAIKVLRPDLAEAIGADRFLREIRTTANLSHRNILPLFDSGDVDGLLYYVMPFVEGESLADRLKREGQLPVEDAVQLAREVAEALAYAHEEGVIHRDIKPANILLERGHALLADFGIAQAKAGADETKLTGIGMSLGTPSYMSPEQIAGNREVDGRSDQYALGCVLYEMLAGHPPFEGADIQTVMRQHLAAEVPNVTGARAAVPSGVAKAIHRALAKTPADRYRTVAEFEKALAGATLPLLGRIPLGRARSVAYGGVAVLLLAAVAVVFFLWRPEGPDLAEDLVAVLPFANETGDVQYDSETRMLARSIIDRLDRKGIARVIPYSEISLSWDAALERRVGEPNHNPRSAVVAEYGTGTLVAGSVFPFGDSLRIDAEVIRSVGAERVVSIFPVVVAPDRFLAGIDSVSERVAAAVAQHLDPGLNDVPSVFLTDPPRSLAVLEAMDQAYEAWANRERQESRMEIERALELDPGYLPARTFLAHLLVQLGQFSLADSILEDLEKHRQEMGPVERIQWEYDKAELEGDLEAQYRSLKAVTQRTPTPVGRLSFAWAARALNRPREPLEAIEDLDPESPSLVRVGQSLRLEADRCEYLHLLGEHHQELREAQRLRSAYPRDARPLLAEIRARAALGQVGEVEALVEESIQGDLLPVSAVETAVRELRAHGHAEATQALGEKFLAYLQQRPPSVQRTRAHRFNLYGAFGFLERWEEAQAVAEALAEEQPSNLFYLSLRGTVAAHRGQREEALGMAEEIAAIEPPYDRGRTAYFRACIASLLGERDEAVRLLNEAHDQGWPFDIRLHTDPDLEPLWGYPPFVEFMRPKG